MDPGVGRCGYKGLGTGLLFLEIGRLAPKCGPAPGHCNFCRANKQTATQANILNQRRPFININP